MWMRAFLVATIGLLTVTACGMNTLVPAAPRTLDEMVLSFAAEPFAPPGVVSADVAIANLRARGVAIPRNPDVVEYGTAWCERADTCDLRSPERRAVLVVQWTKGHPAPEWGTFIVDATTGELLGGIAGP